MTLPCSTDFEQIIRALSQREAKVFLCKLFLSRAIHEHRVQNVLTPCLGEWSAQRVTEDATSLDDEIEECKSLGVNLGPGYRSPFWQRLSEGCRHCSEDTGCTIRLTTSCNRKCFFCFESQNPTVPGYAVSRDQYVEEIKRRMQETRIESFAISGGEPLLFPDDAIDCLSTAKHLLGPDVYMRLYSNGDLLSRAILTRLCAVGLDEIRLSIKSPEPTPMEALRACKEMIPNVWVEIPALPDTEKSLENLVLQLESTGITGLNLVELFYSGMNDEEYASRGYRLRPVTIRRLYDSMPAFEYPVSGSREVCFHILRFAALRKSQLAIHLCLHESKRLMFTAKNSRLARSRCLPWQTVDADGFLKELCIVGGPSLYVENVLSHFPSRRESLCGIPLLRAPVLALGELIGAENPVFELTWGPMNQGVSDVRLIAIGSTRPYVRQEAALDLDENIRVSLDRLRCIMASCNTRMDSSEE